MRNNQLLKSVSIGPVRRSDSTVYRDIDHGERYIGLPSTYVCRHMVHRKLFLFHDKFPGHFTRAWQPIIKGDHTRLHSAPLYWICIGQIDRKYGAHTVLLLGWQTCIMTARGFGPAAIGSNQFCFGRRSESSRLGVRTVSQCTCAVQRSGFGELIMHIRALVNES